jgi:hypothetical protein
MHLECAAVDTHKDPTVVLCLLCRAVLCCAVQGYGKFLISLAYCLSHLEGKPGTAERPLSDLGAVSFRSYWTRQVLDALRDCKGEVTVQVCGQGLGAWKSLWVQDSGGSRAAWQCVQLWLSTPSGSSRRRALHVMYGV